MPYRVYSELFVLAVLVAWASGMSDAQVRDEFRIAESTRRRILSSARRRICALLACGVSRAAVNAAIPAAHMTAFGTRLAQNVRLINPHIGLRGGVRGGVTHIGGLDKPFRHGLKPTVQATMRLGEAQISHEHARRFAASVDVVKLKDCGSGYWPGLEVIIENREFIWIRRNAMGLEHRSRIRKLRAFRNPLCAQFVQTALCELHRQPSLEKEATQVTRALAGASTAWSQPHLAAQRHTATFGLSGDGSMVVLP